MRDTDLPVEAQLHGVTLYSDNCFEIVLRLHDGSYISVQWAPETPEYEKLLEFLTSHASRRLAVLGDRGIVITGPTARDEDDE